MFDMYSGYVPIDGTSKMIHYLFVTSQNDPVNDPLVIWFNGGPGCSSMLAFAQEHGPFLQSNINETFTENKYSWNKFANMLYIEQPAGVGYSYCDFNNHPEDCQHNDNTIAKDNLAAILNWFEKFPEYKPNNLYISGESYGGIYVPYTSNAIYHHNQIAKTTGAFQPNLQGFMVGNGVTNWKLDTSPAYLKMGFWHSLYDYDTYLNMTALNCDFSGVNFGRNPTPDCEKIFDKFNTLVQDVNIYNIFGFCYGLDPSSSNVFKSNEIGITSVGGQIKTYKKSFTADDYTPWATHKAYKQKKGLKETPPCVNG
jgi:carboxypeptidase C (cathepsin A)